MENVHRSLLCALRGASLIAFVILVAFFACSDDDPVGPGGEVASITLDAPASFLAIGEDLQLSATPRDGNGNPVSADVSWSSSNSNIATVDGNGVVHGVALGDVRAIATAGEETASMDLTVRELGALLSGRIERPVITLEPGLEYRAVGDLELFADSLLIIAGDLIIEAGVSVSAGSLDTTIVTGNIVVDTLSTLATWSRFTAGGAPSDDLTLWGSNLSIGGPTGLTDINSNGTVNIGGIVGPNGVGELILSGVYINSADGERGTKSNPNGQAGKNIEIGSETAQNAAAAASGRPGAPFPYIGLQRNVAAVAGQGGFGFPIFLRADATVASNTITAVGGNGGRGGSVRIEAGEVSFSNATSVYVVGGPGGGGGSIGFDLAPEIVLSGTGPNGEGESLIGTTGSGNQGGDANVNASTIIGGPGTVRGGRGGSPGIFDAVGGNGINGAAGGDFTARVGLKGSPGTGTVAGVVQPEPDPAHPTIVDVEDAMNGGNATTSAMTGGAGGKLEVTDASGFGPAAVSQINVSNSVNGGNGYNGCIVDPQVNGTNGGPGGTFKSLNVAMTINTLSFFGGVGGNGMQPGAGGAEGRNLDTDTPLGLRGPDGDFCPVTLLITSNTNFIVFTHTVGVSPCPQLVATVDVTNASGQQISVTPTVVDTNAMSYAPLSAFPLGPGETRNDVTVRYECVAPFISFNARFRFVARQGAAEQILDIPIIATIQDD